MSRELGGGNEVKAFLGTKIRAGDAPEPMTHMIVVGVVHLSVFAPDSALIPYWWRGPYSTQWHLRQVTAVMEQRGAHLERWFIIPHSITRYLSGHATFLVAHKEILYIIS